MRQFTVSPGEEGQNVFKFASRILAKAPGSMVHKFIRNKNVELNGKKAAEKTVLRSGDVVSFFLSDETFNKFAVQPKPEGGKKQLKAALSVFEGNVLFQNEHVLFVNKWDNIISQSDGDGEVSLNDLLLEYMGDKFKSYTVKPSIANRLDRNTTGVVACGLSAAGLKELNALIKDRDIKKTYLAFSVGKSSLSGEYSAFLGKDNASNTVTVSDRAENDSFREIKTGFEVYCTLKAQNEIITVYNVHLITGRPHQIRAHLKYLGYPVLGDLKYCNEESLRVTKLLGVNRQFLHALSMGFPKLKGALATLSNKEIKAPLPSDMNKYMKYRI